QSCRFEEPEVFGDGRAARVEVAGDLANRQWTPAQQTQDLTPGRIGDGAEDGLAALRLYRNHTVTLMVTVRLRIGKRLAQSRSLGCEDCGTSCGHGGACAHSRVITTHSTPLPLHTQFPRTLHAALPYLRATRYLQQPMEKRGNERRNQTSNRGAPLLSSSPNKALVREGRPMSARALEEKMAVEDRITKLEANVGHLRSDVTAVKTDLKELRSELGAFRKDLSAEISAIKADLAVQRAETGAIRAETGAIRAETGAIRTETGAIKADLASFKVQMAAFQTDVAKEFGSVRVQLERNKLWMLVTGVATIVSMITAAATLVRVLKL